MTGGAGAARYVASRLAVGVGTLVVVSMLVFLAIHLVPGGYADVVLSPLAPPRARANLIAQYGLDQPLPVQYVNWAGQLLHGNLGVMMSDGEPVADLLARRLPVTVELTLLSFALAVLVGVPLAVVAGMARSRFASGSSRLGAALSMSTPDFVLGSVLVYLFSRYSLGLPVSGFVPFGEDPVQNLRSMILPALSLGLFGVAIVIRTGRDAVVTAVASPHAAAATARGESTGHIVRHHVLRNAAIPMVTVLAAFVGTLFGGAVIEENLFSLPGMGQAILNAINQRDYAMVQSAVLIAAAAFILVSMLADFAYGVIDPRVAHQE